MKINLCLTIIILTLFSCKKNCISPYSSLNGKLKSIEFIATDSYKIAYQLRYDSILKKVNSIRILVKGANSDSFFFDGEYLLNYQANIITIDEIGLDNVSNFHRYNVYFDNNKNITAFTEIDTSINVEFPFIRCVLENNKIDSFYEKYYWPTAFNRQCYDYVFDGKNYTGFKFEYDWYVIFGGNVHVVDSAKIDYSYLLYNQFAPMQNMYSANSLFNIGSLGEITYDILYFLGLEGYKFYTPNKNLVNTIRTYDDSTSIVYMNYEFNLNNQLTKFYVNFRTPSYTFFTYTFEYY